jgi:hypothetical protein
VSLDKLLHELAGSVAEEMPPASEAICTFTESCRRTDGDPREQQRITHIADLLDAEGALYAQAQAAFKRGHQHTALPLLRQSADAGTGEAAWLLARLLEDLGYRGEAIIWYQRAADDGDSRAIDKLARISILHRSAAWYRSEGIRAALVSAGRVRCERRHDCYLFAPAGMNLQSARQGSVRCKPLLTCRTGHLVAGRPRQIPERRCRYRSLVAGRPRRGPERRCRYRSYRS